MTSSSLMISAASDDIGGGGGGGGRSSSRNGSEGTVGKGGESSSSSSSTTLSPRLRPQPQNTSSVGGASSTTATATTWTATTTVPVQNTTTSTSTSTTNINNDGTNINISINNMNNGDITNNSEDLVVEEEGEHEEGHITSTELADMLVLAQYRYQSPSSSSQLSSSSSHASSSCFLWWPALKFNSHHQLHNVVPKLEKSLKGCVESRRLQEQQQQQEENEQEEDHIYDDDDNIGQSHDGHQSHNKNKNNNNNNTRAMHSIKADVMTEFLDGPMEVLLYLGRPLDEYKSAACASGEAGIQIHDLIANLRQLEQHCFGKPMFFPSETLYWDFHRAMDFATSVLKHSSSSLSSSSFSGRHGHASGSSISSSSSTGDIGSVTITNSNKFLTMASKAWDEYQDGLDQQQQQQEQEPSPILQPQPQQQQQHHHRHHHRHHQQNGRHDYDNAAAAAAAAAAGSPMSNSVAAVSLADDSTAHSGSLMNGNNSMAQRRPYPGPLQPPLLTNALSSPVKKYESFDDVWHKHELDGWNRYLAATAATTTKKKTIAVDGNDDDDGLVYKAPNGYVFESSKMFQQYLNEAYDWTGPLPPSKKMSTRIAKTKRSSSSRTSSRRRRVSTGGVGSDDDDDDDDWTNGKSFGRFFDYLKTLGWSWWPATKNIQGYTTYYCRPDRGLDKNKTDDMQLGVDFFGTEDDVLTYCRQHNIRPPPSPPKQQPKKIQLEQQVEKQSSASHDEDQMELSTGEESQSSQEEEEENHDDGDDDEESSEDEGMEEDIDTGYETPTDQPTSPRDPGKPLSRSPDGSDGYSDNKSFGDDDERYEWTILWERLKKLGWTFRKAPNKLEDWWWIRTGGEANGEMKRGLDYFASKEDVIAFCKQRDKEFEAGRTERKKQKKSRQDQTETSHAPPKQDRTAKAKKGKRSRETVGAGVKSPKRKASAKINQQKKDQDSKIKRRTKKHSIPKDLNDRRHPCNDANLVVPALENSAVWAQDPPLYNHALCVEATGIVYSGSSYSYSVGDTVHRYDTLKPFVQDFARRKEFMLSNGSRTPDTVAELQFKRAVAYSFVPGMKSEWDTTRSLSQSEASLLLQELGYSKSNDGAWIPPAAMIDAGVLKMQYPNLEELCGALYSLEDLVAPPGKGSRRHRGTGGLTNTQMMALRLSIAEPFEDEADQDDKTESNIISLERKGESPPPKKFSSKKRRTTQVEEVDVDDVPSTPPQEADDEESPLEALSPSKIKVVTFEHAIAENPAPWAKENPEGGKWSYIFFDMGFKFQGGYYYLPNEEPRNFSTRFTAPSDIQVHLCRLGEDQYRNYLDNLDEPDRKRMKRYLNYGCVPGKWNDWRPIRLLTRNEIIQFLELLGFVRSSDESWIAAPHLVEIGGRHFHSLKTLFRALRSIPELERQRQTKRRRRGNEEEVLNRYQILALRLCIAEGLVSGSETSEKELESPHNGNDRKDKAIEEEKDDHGDTEQQFYSPDGRNTPNDSSLREDDRSISRGGRFEEAVDAATTKSSPESKYEDNKGDISSSMTPPDAKSIHDVGTAKSPTEVAIKGSENFLSSICSHPDAWKILMDLGCSYTGGRYRLPTEVPSSECLDNQNLLVQYILENGVSVLNWDECSLTVDQTRTLHTYLKSFHALKVTKYYPIHEPFKLAADERRIFECLQRLGFKKDGDTFVFTSNSIVDETTYTLEDVVNLIRTVKDLPSIGSPVKRRPTYGKESSSKFLSRVELLALRIWASKSDFLLPGFSDAYQLLRSKSLVPVDSSQSYSSSDGQPVAEQNLAAPSDPEDGTSMAKDDIPADDNASFHDSWSRIAEDGDTICREDPNDLHAMEEDFDTTKEDHNSQNSDQLADSTPQASSKKVPPSSENENDGKMPSQRTKSRMTEDESMDDDDNDDDDCCDDFNVDGYDANRRSAFSHSLASLPVTQPEYDDFEDDGDYEESTGQVSIPGHGSYVQHQTEEGSTFASNSNSSVSGEVSSHGPKTVAQQLKDGVKSVWKSWNKSSGVTDSLATIGDGMSSPIRKRKGSAESSHATESITATDSRKRSKRVSTTPTDLLAQFGSSIEDHRLSNDETGEESENDDDNDDDHQSRNNHVVRASSKEDESENDDDDDDQYDPSEAGEPGEGGDERNEFLRDIDFLHAEMIVNGDVP